MTKPRAKRKKPKAPRSTVQLQAAFLQFYAESGNITWAAHKAKIDRGSHYVWRDDPAYAALFDQAHEAAADALEYEARRRAKDGWLEPVYHQGEQVGAVRRFDSTLLIFLLKGLRPEKYRERYEHTGKDGAALIPNIIRIVSQAPKQIPHFSNGNGADHDPVTIDAELDG